LYLIVFDSAQLYICFIVNQAVIFVFLLVLYHNLNLRGFICVIVWSLCYFFP